MSKHVLAGLLALVTLPATAEPGVAISGAVQHPKTWTIAELASRPSTREAVFLHTGHGVISGSFRGVLLWTLLQEAEVKIDPSIKNDIIRHSIVVTGSDGYAAVLSLGEVDPELGGDQAILAIGQDGAGDDKKGEFPRLIIPGDKAAGRSVSGVATIEIR